MFWNKKDLTVLEVIDRELERLHKELSSYNEDAISDDSMAQAYSEVLAQIDKLNQQLINITKGSLDG